MAKSITRTITDYTIHFLALDNTETVVTLEAYTDESNPAMPKHPEKVAVAAAEELGFTFIKVKQVDTDTDLYSMSVADFIKYAKIVD